MGSTNLGAKKAPTQLQDALQYTPLVSLLPVQSGTFFFYIDFFMDFFYLGLIIFNSNISCLLFFTILQYLIQFRFLI